jgi:GH25 family lysozyme M1 (1,4-beta-N-acetylmuramidase)
MLSKKIMSRKFTTFVRGGLILCLSILVSVSVHAQRLLGVDVSGFQGDHIAWATLKSAHNVVFAWTKASDGDVVPSNMYFADHENDAIAAGVYIGAYHFAEPHDDPNITGANSAASEATNFWNQAGSYITSGNYQLVPALDWEDTGATKAAGFTTTQMSQWVNEWCNVVSNFAAAQGVILQPVIYTGAWYSDPGSVYPGLNSTVTQWPIWISGSWGCTDPQTCNPSDTSPWPSWDIWQYGSSTLLPGTTFDEDVYNGTSLTSFLQTFGVGDQLPTVFNWVASSPADYSVAADWFPSGVPNGASIVVNFTNNVTCNYSAGDNYSLSQMFLGPLDNSTGKFSMGGGTLSITNGAGAYSLILGATGANSVGSFTNEWRHAECCKNNSSPYDLSGWSRTRCWAQTRHRHVHPQRRHGEFSVRHWKWAPMVPAYLMSMAAC